MHKFTDADGREHVVAITVREIKKCRELLDFDLLDAQTAIQQLMCDPIVLCDVIFVCLQDEPELTDERFASSMRGDSIKGAKKAIVEELISFSDGPEDRKNLRAAVDKFGEMALEIKKRIGAKLGGEAISREIDAALDKIDLELDKAIASINEDERSSSGSGSSN